MGIRRAALTLSALCLAFAAAPVSSLAGPLLRPATPLAVVAGGERPSCGERFAPLTSSELRTPPSSDQQLTLELSDGVLPPSPTDVELGVADELEATTRSGELQPAIVICSATYPGIPGAPTGITAAKLDRSRVAPGWREVGSTLLESAALRAGDKLELPAVDAGAQLRVHVTSYDGGATTPITFTDLSLPSTLTVTAQEGGLTARLARQGGATTDVVAADRRAPEPALSISGTPRSWQVTTQHLPNTAILAGLSPDEDPAALVRASATGTARFTLPYDGRARKSLQLVMFTTNYDAHLTQIVNCKLAVRRRALPTVEECRVNAGTSLLMGFVVLIGESVDEADALRATLAPATAAQGLLARLRAASPRQPEAAPPSDRAVVQSLAASRAAASPVALPKLSAVPRSSAMVRLGAYGATPLQHDINADRQPDFWTDLGGWGVPRKQRRDFAGYVFISSPRGLVPRRVKLPGGGADALNESEISSIADVTGDGVGELIVDVGERHAFIPSHRGLSQRTGPIDAGRRTGATRRVIAPSLSSPGAPYAALDDVTGDRRRELLVADDSGTGVVVDSSQLGGTGVLPLAAGTGGYRTPKEITDRHRRTQAPKGNPGLRIIAGQAITTSWELSTALLPGRATFTVRDASGADVRAPVTLSTTGDASLLDYDRPSGDLLVWVAPAGCTYSCRQALLRVAPDGTVRQQLQSTSDDGLDLSSARFIEDGPDADGGVEVAFSRGGDGLGIVPSSLLGELTSSQLGTLRLDPIVIGGKRYRASGGWRPLPLVAPDGSRTTIIAGTRLRLRRGVYVSRYPDVGNAPLRLHW